MPDASDREPLRYRASEEAVERVINRLVKESVAASSTNGFLTGLGGFVTMPITVPANIAGALVINARLVGSIAYLRGTTSRTRTSRPSSVSRRRVGRWRARSMVSESRSGQR